MKGRFLQVTQESEPSFLEPLNRVAGRVLMTFLGLAVKMGFDSIFDALSIQPGI